MHPDAPRAQRLTERLVLRGELRGVGLRMPAVLAPGSEPGGAGRADEHAAKRPRHRLAAEETCRGHGHQPKKA